MLMELNEIFQKWLNKIRGVQTTTSYYTAIVLTYWDRLRLVSRFRSHIPKGWKIVAHHMTINMGKAEDEDIIAPNIVGQAVTMRVVGLGQDDRVIAVAVESDVPSKNEQKHITLAVAPGASAKDSNELVHWEPVEGMTLRGTIREVPREVPGEPGKDKISRPQSTPASDDPIKFIQVDMKGKPEGVVRIAMKGKFPELSEEEINGYIAKAKNTETT